MAPHLCLLKTEHLWRQKQMWRHLSIAVVAHKTVVQRVRSNRWRFNFEMAGGGGQINFLWKTAMIIATTNTSILIICPFPRGLLLMYPLSPPLILTKILNFNRISKICEILVDQWLCLHKFQSHLKSMCEDPAAQFKSSLQASKPTYQPTFQSEEPMM